MGILEELIILVKESLDEAKQNQRPPEPSETDAPPRRSPEEIEALKRTLAKRAMQQRAADEATAAPTPLSPDAKHRAKYDQERLRLHQQHLKDGPAKVNHHSSHQVATLLRQPQTLRQLIVLKEILDLPISQRGGNRR
jgi:hypothetical protein